MNILTKEKRRISIKFSNQNLIGEKCENKYRIFPFNVGKCWSQLQTVSCGSGQGQNHHKGWVGSHNRFFWLRNKIKIMKQKIIIIKKYFLIKKIFRKHCFEKDIGKDFRIELCLLNIYHRNQI